jgi:hypothetical protein
VKLVSTASSGAGFYLFFTPAPIVPYTCAANNHLLVGHLTECSFPTPFPCLVPLGILQSYAAQCFATSCESGVYWNGSQQKKITRLQLFDIQQITLQDSEPFLLAGDPVFFINLASGR